MLKQALPSCTTNKQQKKKRRRCSLWNTDTLHCVVFYDWLSRVLQHCCLENPLIRVKHPFAHTELQDQGGEEISEGSGWKAGRKQQEERETTHFCQCSPHKASPGTFPELPSHVPSQLALLAPGSPAPAASRGAHRGFGEHKGQGRVGAQALTPTEGLEGQGPPPPRTCTSTLQPWL